LTAKIFRSAARPFGFPGNDQRWFASDFESQRVVAKISDASNAARAASIHQGFRAIVGARRERKNRRAETLCEFGEPQNRGENCTLFELTC